MIRLFRIFFPTTVLVLLFSEMILLFFSFILVSFYLLDVDPQFFLIEEDGLLRISIVVGSILAGMHMQDLYSELKVRTRILLVQQMCMSFGLAFLVQALMGYGKSPWIVPRWMMILGSGVGLTLLVAWRFAYSAVVLKAIRGDRLLLIGGSPVLAEVASRVAARPELGVTVIGQLTENGTVDEIPGIQKLGELRELKAVLERERPDRIVVGMSERRLKLPVIELLQARLSGIRVEEVASTYEMAFGRVCLRELKPSQLVFSEQLGPSPNSVAYQSLYSFTIALASVLVAAPLILLTAVLVRLSSRGPILYRQKRVGLDGKVFTVYKFRSMYVDAESRTGAVWATRDDPRITPVGRFLRKARLDELPQLFNVLKGDMSMVGPRPERPEFVQALSEQIPYYRQRHCVKPGITGWAQINYKYGDTLEDTVTKLEYDLYYIKNISFALDTYILLNTMKTVLLGRGGQ